MLVQEVIYPASTPGAASSSHVITLDQQATAGYRLIVFASAPAVVTISGFTKHDNNLGNCDIAIFSKVADGSETSITVSLSGSRRLQAVVLERDDVGSFITSADRSQSAASSFAFGAISMTEGDHVFACLATSHHITVGAATAGSWSPTTDEHLDRFLGSAASGDEDIWLCAVSGTAPSTASHAYTASGLLASGPTQQGVIAVFAAESILPPAETVIEEENRLAGTAQSTWDVTGVGDTSIQGFATTMSVDQGDEIDFKIHSPNAFTVDIYRLGYYGGDGARLVDTVSGSTTTQPSGSVDGTTQMADCSNWTVSASWTVPSDACPGVYIARPKKTSGGGASHIPFVVRDSSRKAPVLIVTSDSTWQAYNHSGADPADPLNGKSLYGSGTSSSFGFNASLRCKAVSYNRPWVTRQFLPQTFLFNSEYPLIRWVERNGYDVDYASCVDIEADPTLLTGRDVVIVHGHSEYWSAGMRDAVVAARDDGVHQLILSANEIFWRIRWDGSQRTYACWKDSLDGALNATGQYSGTWQDTRGFNPDRRPPQALTGQFFKINGIYQTALAVPDTYKDHPVWRDTSVATLTSGNSRTYSNLIGFETDEDRDHSDRPDTWIRWSETTITGLNDLISDENGAVYDGDGGAVHHLGAYRAPSGAVVVGAGTVQLAWGLDATHDRTATSEQDDIQQMFMNLLADLGVTCPDASRQPTLVEPTPVDLADYGFPTDRTAVTQAGSQLRAAGTKQGAGSPTQTGTAQLLAAGTKAITGAADQTAAPTIAAAGTKATTGASVLPGTAAIAAAAGVKGASTAPTLSAASALRATGAKHVTSTCRMTAGAYLAPSAPAPDIAVTVGSPHRGWSAGAPWI